jgi:hypothetical protein
MLLVDFVEGIILQMIMGVQHRTGPLRKVEHVRLAEPTGKLAA